MNRLTFRDRVAEFFKRNEGRWIPAIEFEAVGGRQAWRSRIAECRTVLGLEIENRCQRVMRSDGSFYVLSEYRFTAPKGQMQMWEWTTK